MKEYTFIKSLKIKNTACVLKFYNLKQNIFS